MNNYCYGVFKDCYKSRKEEQERRKEIEKFLVRVNWKIESKKRSLEQEKEWLVKQAQRVNTNCAKLSCERIKQLEDEILIHETYKYELEAILKWEDLKK